MKLFDRTFVISVKRLQDERLKGTMAHLTERGIEAEPFWGMDFDVTGLRTDHVYEVDHPGSGYRITPKMANMHLSHYVLWTVCSYIEGDAFTVFEDDVRFDPDWKEHYDVAVAALPNDWDILFIGSCCCANKPNSHVTGRLYGIKYALCTHAYAIRKRAARVLVDTCQKVWTNVDIAMMFGALPSLKAYAILPRIAHQDATNIPP